MIGIPRQFDDHPDPAVQRLTIISIMSASAGALQLAGLNMRRLTDLEHRAGNVGDDAHTLLVGHADAIDGMAESIRTFLAALPEV